MLQELMNNFYFTEKEAKVYLAALKLGRSRVSDIAKSAELNRITTYEVLKRLLQMGVAHSAVYSGVKTFVVVAPSLLVEKMQSRLQVAQQILPRLALLNRANSNKPSIAFFEGADGLRTIYEGTLACQDKVILNIANPQNLLATIGHDFFTQYVRKRAKRKIQVKVLLPDTPENKKFKSEEKKSKREIKLFDAQKYPLPNEVLIYDNKVAMLSFASLIGVVVEDKDIVQSLRSMWQMVWDAV
ncbi:hypothetical protein A2482_00880 [Candidatus Falkowbacteria bacterium RIFOXYC2_FULL_48_21]|uniref:Transcription regulator TrmB N-terminal domain-containing protein n=1 Tax=Candidatus Falkowbacteria bacterium RIFOXYC2_FULL_48_21 TaxID=1798005 RepID=A0A1F5T6U0_9BACT|nr:MAG: hypothetical protein A2482_00880 [Candidatus Falkowbacteria bacterium RIFOXYC2_FULL_48_21]